MSKEYDRWGYDHYSRPRGSPRGRGRARGNHYDRGGRGSSLGRGGRDDLDRFGRGDSDFRNREMGRPGDWPRDARRLVRSSPSQRPSPVPSSSSVRDDAAADASNRPQADAAVKRQRIAPNPAPSKVQSAQPPNAFLDADTRRVTELVCERVFWYMRRDDADKRFKKLQSDTERCRTAHSDFGSAYEILKLTKDAAEEERAKCCSRVGDADEKLFSAMRSAMARPVHQVKAIEATNPDERPTRDVESWTKDAQELVESSRKSLRGEFELETARLQAQLDKERKRNELLEERVDELGRKMIVLDEAKQRADRQETARCSGLQKAQELALANFGAKIEEATKDLVSRVQLDEALRVFDGNVSSLTIGTADEQQQSHSLKPGDRTASKLQSFVEGMESLQSSLQSLGDAGQLSLRVEELRRDVDAHSGTIKKQAEELVEATSAMGDRGSLAVRLSADLLAEVPKHPLFQQAVRVEVERLLQKEFLPMLVEKMKGYFDKEKAERAAIAKEAEKTANNASEILQDLNSLKGAINKSIHSLVHQAAQQGTELVSQKERLNTAESNIEAAKTGAKAGMEELALQLGDVKSWQNNFNTRPLYRDIVQHINETIPTGVVNQLRQLTVRVEGSRVASRRTRVAKLPRSERSSMMALLRRPAAASRGKKRLESTEAWNRHTHNQESAAQLGSCH